VLIVVMVVIFVMITIVVSTAMADIFQLLATLMGLAAIFAVTLNRVTQPVFCLVNLPFASFVPLVPLVLVSFVRPGQQRGTHQSANCQQSNTKQSDCTNHPCSLEREFVRFHPPALYQSDTGAVAGHA
jgi:hypothetical protein